MKKILTLLVACMFVLGSAGNLLAGDKPIKADAEAMVTKALTYIKAHGKDKALAEFNNPKGEFVKGELYIFAYDFTGTNKALAANPAMVGKNQSELQDADGKFLIKDLMTVANSGGGWYEYKWAHPATKEIKDKASYIAKVDDTLWLGCGVYK